LIGKLASCAGEAVCPYLRESTDAELEVRRHVDEIDHLLATLYGAKRSHRERDDCVDLVSGLSFAMRRSRFLESIRVGN
jgi:hypothetical protein